MINLKFNCFSFSYSLKFLYFPEPTLICNDSESRVFHILIDKIDPQISQKDDLSASQILATTNCGLTPDEKFSRVLLDFSHLQLITALDIHPDG